MLAPFPVDPVEVSSDLVRRIEPVPLAIDRHVVVGGSAHVGKELDELAPGSDVRWHGTKSSGVSSDQTARLASNGGDCHSFPRQVAVVANDAAGR